MKRSHSSSLFLFELILDLALFAVCAAVCVGLLLQARSMSRESACLTDAVYLAQSAAENLRLGLPVADRQDGYEIAAVQTPEDGITRFTVTVSLADRALYSLDGAYPAEVAP